MGLSVKCDYEDVPEIVVEKHKVLQILINLLRNAKYACEASASGRTDWSVMSIAKQTGRCAHQRSPTTGSAYSRST